MSWQRGHKAVVHGNIRSVQNIKANSDIKTKQRKTNEHTNKNPQLGLCRCSLLQKYSQIVQIWE